MLSEWEETLMGGGPEFSSKNIPVRSRADELASYNHNDWPGSESFNPPGFSKAVLDAQSESGTVSGRFHISESNITELSPLNPKDAIEIVPGKKYLAVLDVRGLSQDSVHRVTELVEAWSARFRERGFDIQFLASALPITFYEVEPIR